MEDNNVTTNKTVGEPEKDMASSEDAVNTGLNTAASDTSTVSAENSGFDAALEADGDVIEATVEITEKELKELREENRRLKSEAEARARFEKESEELLLLFPEAQTDALPEEVTESHKSGIPLAAAYALWDKRRILAETNAEASNRLNAAASPGPVSNDGSGEGSFTLEEIKRMPVGEVKKHLERIYKSLEKQKNN